MLCDHLAQPVYLVWDPMQSERQEVLLTAAPYRYAGPAPALCVEWKTWLDQRKVELLEFEWDIVIGWTVDTSALPEHNEPELGAQWCGDLAETSNPPGPSYVVRRGLCWHVPDAETKHVSVTVEVDFDKADTRFQAGEAGVDAKFARSRRLWRILERAPMPLPPRERLGSQTSHHQQDSNAT